MEGHKLSNELEVLMSSRHVALALVFVLAAIPIFDSSPHAAPPSGKVRQALEDQLPPTYVPPGKQTYKEYCAACHGFDGKGGGPAASSLNKQPPNLTTLIEKTWW